MEFAKILKANPYGINQYTKGSPGRVAVGAHHLKDKFTAEIAARAGEWKTPTVPSTEAKPPGKVVVGTGSKLHLLDKPKSTASLTVNPTFSSRSKVTVQSASEALAKQGIKLEHAGMSGFSPNYKLTGKDGSTKTVSAKELTKMLTKKSAFTY